MVDQAFRTESDSLGEVSVPADRYWGAQTERARQMFRLGQEPMPLALIHSIARIKRAAALANHGLGQLDAHRCRWISQAAEEVEQGQLDAEFPLSTWQSGSGTQTNMNLNEVIANRACELAGQPRGSKATVHPNDHVMECAPYYWLLSNHFLLLKHCLYLYYHNLLIQLILMPLAQDFFWIIVFLFVKNVVQMS